FAARRCGGTGDVGFVALFSFGRSPRVFRSRAQLDRLLEALDDPGGWRRKHAWMSLSFLATLEDLEFLRARRDGLREEAPPAGVARSFEQLELLPERWNAERVVARLELLASALGRERRWLAAQPLALAAADAR